MDEGRGPTRLFILSTEFIRYSRLPEIAYDRMSREFDEFCGLVFRDLMEFGYTGRRAFLSEGLEVEWV